MKNHQLDREFTIPPLPVTSVCDLGETQKQTEKEKTLEDFWFRFSQEQERGLVW